MLWSLKALSVAFYLLGLLWAALHPFVSITTGELKPRSLFIDEHALPIYSSIVENTIRYNQTNRFSEFNVCEGLVWDFGASSCVSLFDDSVQQLLIRPKHVPRPTEAISLYVIVPYVGVGQEAVSSTERDILSLVYNIFDAYSNVPWSAKELEIVLARNSSILNSYLLLRMDSNSTDRTSSWDINWRMPKSVMREAFVVDFTLLQQHPLSGLRFSYQHLLTHDHQEQQANMDLIAFLLNKHAATLQFPPTTRSFQTYIDSAAASVDSAFRRFLPTAWYPRSSTHSKFSIRPRVHGYLTHLMTRAIGFDIMYDRALRHVQEHVLHPLLSRNVDALALQPVPVNDTSAVSGSAVKGPAELLSILMDLIYGCNYLEEELHHSFQLYLFMGDSTFVGVSEYGGATLCLLLAFYLLVLALCPWPVVYSPPKDKSSSTPRATFSMDINVLTPAVLCCVLVRYLFESLQGIPVVLVAFVISAVLHILCTPSRLHVLRLIARKLGIASLPPTASAHTNAVKAVMGVLLALEIFVTCVLPLSKLAVQEVGVLYLMTPGYYLLLWFFVSTVQAQATAMEQRRQVQSAQQRRKSRRMRGFLTAARHLLLCLVFLFVDRLAVREVHSSKERWLLHWELLVTTLAGRMLGHAMISVPAIELLCQLFFQFAQEP